MRGSPIAQRRRRGGRSVVTGDALFLICSLFTFFIVPFFHFFIFHVFEHFFVSRTELCADFGVVRVFLFNPKVGVQGLKQGGGGVGRDQLLVRGQHSMEKASSLKDDARVHKSIAQ